MPIGTERYITDDDSITNGSKIMTHDIQKVQKYQYWLSRPEARIRVCELLPSNSISASICTNLIYLSNMFLPFLFVDSGQRSESVVNLMRTNSACRKKCKLVQSSFVVNLIFIFQQAIKEFRMIFSGQTHLISYLHIKTEKAILQNDTNFMVISSPLTCSK